MTSRCPLHPLPQREKRLPQSPITPRTAIFKSLSLIHICSQAQAARPQRDRNRDAVQAPKGEFIEGRRAAAEALRTGFPVKCALIAEGGERDVALSRLVDDLNAAGVRIKYVPRAQLDALSSHGAHQGLSLIHISFV